MLVRSVSTFAIAATLAYPALAADAENQNYATPPIQLAAASNVIIVTGTRDAYGAETVASGTRTETPLRDIPQAISVVTERQIEDQSLRSIGDVLRNVPGAMTGQGEGHRDQVTLRGNNSTADFFVDGLRDDVQYYRPLYNLQRVEVLKGPNAMIFGRGGGGGVINRVTKQPLFTNFAAGSASADSYGAWYADADLNGALSANAGMRLNAVYENFRNHRDAYEGRLIAANPSLRYLPTPNTGLALSYEYADDERVVDRGVPSSNGRPITGFRDTFFGVRGFNEMTLAAHVGRANLEHRFSSDVTLNSRLMWGDYDKFYRNAYPNSAVSTNAGGQQQLAIGSYADGFQRESLFSQNDLVLKRRTGGIGHTLLAGVEYGLQRGDNQRYNGSSATILLSDTPQIPAPTLVATPTRSTRSDVDVFALYAQDQIAFGEQFRVIAGVRYDRFSLEVTDLIAGQAFERTDDLWSPRLGVVAKPIPEVSLYASYSRSYLPQSGDQFNSLDATASALVPERFDNYEIGAKWQARPSILLSAAAYRLDRTNTRSPGPTPGTIVQTGAQRSRGIELEASGSIRRNWQLSAGYAYQEAEIGETTSAAPVGRAVPQVPRHQASLWTRHDFAPGLGIGAGIHHQSESFTSISNAVVLPAHTRVDAAFYFPIAAGFEAQLNVENVLNQAYFPTAHNDNNITTGAPRGVRGTVRFRF